MSSVNRPQYGLIMALLRIFIRESLSSQNQDRVISIVIAEPLVVTDTVAEKSLFVATTGVPKDGENSPASGASTETQHGPPLTAREEKKLLRRIDWHLLPLLSIMYVVKTIDAANVSNARIMDKGTPQNIIIELHMSSDQYNFVTLAYYLPYIVAEAPSNLVLKHFKPSVWQSRVMISWGLVLCCHAAVKNAGGLFAVRALLGLFEAGLWPGILLQLCYWYRPDELAKRIVLTTVFGNFSPIFSGLLAFAFNGVRARGLSGWKWLVLTEGIFTVLLGIFVFFFLPDFPDTAKFLSDQERAYIQGRLPRNSPKNAEKDFNWQEFKDTLKDYRIWLFLGVWGFYTVGTTGLTFYQPTVFASLGFSGIAKAQLLNIPPAVISCSLIFFCGWIQSTARVPYPAIPIFIMVSIMAFYAVEYTYPNIGGVYAATTLAGGFSTAWYVLMWPWRVQTVSGATGSAFALAIANSYGQIGGAVGSQLFNSRFAPRYQTSFAIAMAFLGTSILFACVTWLFTGKIDRELRRVKREKIRAAKTTGEVLVSRDIDVRPGHFRKLANEEDTKTA